MISKKRIFFTGIIALMMCGITTMNAQVTIGADQVPQPFSVLELISNNTRGLRLPQMTEADRDLMTATAEFVTANAAGLAEGLTIFNLNKKCVNVWNGTKWIELCATDQQEIEISCEAGTFPVSSSQEVSITISGTTYRWMTYNLGADPTLTPKQQMAYFPVEPTDMKVYGGWYQWGRSNTAHTFRCDPTPNVLSDPKFSQNFVSVASLPGSDHGKFVFFASPISGGFSSNNFFDWTSPHLIQNNLWGGGLGFSQVKGTNDPCPAGWRVPDGENEWPELFSTGGPPNPAGGRDLSISGPTLCAGNTLYWVPVVNGKVNSAFSANNSMCGYALYTKAEWESSNTDYKNGTLSLTVPEAPNPLMFLPAAGYRNYIDGVRGNVGVIGDYWSSSIQQPSFPVPGGNDFHYSRYFIFDNSILNITNFDYRASGLSVRCIAE